MRPEIYGNPYLSHLYKTEFDGSRYPESARLMESVAVSDTASTPRQPPPAGISLPDEPLVVIQPSKAWVALNLKGLWAYRELLYFLMWRDLKVRYKQSVLGITWVILQPLLTTVIFTIFLGKLARVPSDNIPYPIFVYAALLPWTFFSSAITSSGNSLVGSANLITKVYFPRLIIPGAAVGARLVDFGIAFIILIGLMVYYHIALTNAVLLLPVLVVLVALLALGFGMWTSALNVKYRDVGVALPVLIQLWMFASPVVYPSSIVPAKYQWLYNLNPMVGILDGFRAALFGREINWRALGISTVFTLLLLVYSSYSFRRMEKDFADIV
jgi:homopolymeric O-antigen transport system permease protein